MVQQAVSWRLSASEVAGAGEDEGAPAAAVHIKSLALLPLRRLLLLGSDDGIVRVCS